MDTLYWTVAAGAEHDALAVGREPPGLLDVRERAVLAGMVYPARRRKWLLGRWAAKHVLRHALREAGQDVALSHIVVRNETSGAPFAAVEGERVPWSLSLSHRDDVAFAALGPAGMSPIGADLELVTARDLALVRTFFTEAEAGAVAACRGRAAELAIARIWSAKEAVLKAMRVGLRVDTRRVHVEARGDAGEGGWQPLRVAVITRGDRAEQPFDVMWRDEGGYVLTLAAAACRWGASYLGRCELRQARRSPGCIVG